MSKFETTKIKLQEIWNYVDSNKSDISNKSNNELLSYFTDLLNQQNIKTPLEIYNSGDLFITPSTGSATALKGSKLPSNVSYSELVDVEVPDVFLPFIKYSIEVKPTPESETHALYTYAPSSWEGDYIKIHGDGKIIFMEDIEGISASFVGSFDGSYTFPNSYFSENNINLDLTKEVWRTRITKTDDNVESGNVTRIIANIIDNEETFTVNAFLNPDHKIISLTATTFTAIGDHYDIIGDIFTPNVQRTYTFSALDSYVIGINEGIFINSSNIKSKLFEKNGRWLYWSNLLQKSFVLEILDEKDGDKQLIEIQNFPDTDDSDTLPYTKITVKRNLEGSTDLPVIVEQSSFVAVGQRNLKNYIRISNSNATIPRYRFKLNGNFFIVAPATKQFTVTRSNASISTQEFNSIGIYEWNANINKDEAGQLSGVLQNIYHKKTRVAGSIVTEFFSDPINNPAHAILNITASDFTAIGDETVTIYPVEGEPVITKRNNVTVSDLFADYASYTVTYSLDILNTIDFPIYNDIYTVSGVTYALTTEDHSLLSKEVWLPETQDIILNLKAYLINPLYWREKRKYNKNDL